MQVTGKASERLSFYYPVSTGRTSFVYVVLYPPSLGSFRPRGVFGMRWNVMGWISDSILVFGREVEWNPLIPANGIFG